MKAVIYMGGEVRRTDRKLMYHGRIIDVYQDKMEFGNGNTSYWDFIHHDGAAAVVPVLDDGRILMVSQYRSALGREMLEIPAGKLDSPGEDSLECSKRELEEETGYKSEHLDWLLTLRTSVAYCDEKIDIYVAQNLIPSRQNLDENEFVEVKPFALCELKKKIFSGEIQDSKTIAALLAYEENYLTK